MRGVLIILGMILSINFGIGQGKSFELSIQRDTVLMGNYIIAKFSIINTDGDFEAPAFKDWDIVSGPNTSSMFSMVNGKTTKQASYTYYIKPKTEGELIIEPAYLLNDKDTLETVPHTILVLPNPDGKIIEPEEPSNNMFRFSLPDITDDKSDHRDRDTAKKSKKKRLKTRKL